MARLKALERSGLVRVVRGSGRSPEVTVLDVEPPVSSAKKMEVASVNLRHGD